MRNFVKIVKITLIAAFAIGLFVVWPYTYFRYVYEEKKRFREVIPGQVYRSGQMTAEGFREVVERHHIRTIINVQDDVPDPDVRLSFWSKETIKESDLCKELGVEYRNVAPDLVSRFSVPDRHPEAIDQLLEILDRQESYPVLIHCKAGLHRTGCLVAVYRMEYQGWSNGAAYREMKAHGFGDSACTAANDYVNQYVLTYRPRNAEQGLVTGTGND